MYIYITRRPVYKNICVAACSLQKSFRVNISQAQIPEKVTYWSIFCLKSGSGNSTQYQGTNSENDRYRSTPTFNTSKDISMFIFVKAGIIYRTDLIRNVE